MRSVLLAFALLSSIASYSQSEKFVKPDYDSIEVQVKNPVSQLYYPTLLERYLQGDSTMTLKEKRHVYYGFTFQREYSPYRRSEHASKVNEILNKEKLRQSDYEKVVKLANDELKSNPFDLRMLNYVRYCSEELGDSKESLKCHIKIGIILDALISSGNGKTKAEAFYVITTTHEYDLINIFGLEFGGQQSLIDNCDYLTLKENEYGVDGFYFDVSPCFKFLRRTMGE